MVVSFFLRRWWCWLWLIGAQYGHTRAVYPAAAAVMNGHGSFSGVGAFSVVGHNGVHSSMKIIKKLGLLVFFGGRSWVRTVQQKNY